MSLIRAANAQEIEKVSDIIGYEPSRGARGIYIVNEKDEIGAMAIYDRWTHTAVEMHAWSSSPKFLFRKEFCFAMFDYPFNQQHKMLAFAVTPCDNAPSLALARFLGFTEVYRISDGWKSGTDLVIQELRRENCRFLEQTTDVKVQQVH